MAAAKIVRRSHEIILIDGKGNEIGIEVSFAKEKRLWISDKSFRTLCMTVLAMTAMIIGREGSLAKPIAVILRGILE